MLTQQQFLAMLELQDEMNSVVNPNWREANYNWSRAIMVEAVEAIEHHGWKWWKKQTPDMPQVQMELVDIWHFALSKMMQKHSNKIDLANELAAIKFLEKNDAPVFQVIISDTSLLDCLQNMVELAAGGTFSLVVFSQALNKAGMSWQDLYVMYISKNCLNRFRQSHGYKTGEYIKNWSAVSLISPLAESRALEDNDHLHDIYQAMTASDNESPNLFEFLTSKLDTRYELVKRYELSMEMKSCK